MKNVPIIIFLFILALILIGFFYIVLPFLIAVILAILTSHLFTPIKNFFLRKKYSDSLATVATFLIALLAVIAPIVGLIVLVSSEARVFYQNVIDLLTAENFDFYLMVKETAFFKLLADRGYLSILDSLFVDSPFRAQFINLASTALRWFVNSLSSFLVNLPTFIINVILWIYFTYYLLKDGKGFFQHIKNILPISKEEQDQVTTEIVKMIDATLLGTLVVGILEGIWGGLIFALLDVPAASTWAVLMGILALIPIVGANGILIPTGIYFLVTGDLSSGLIILIAGSGVVGIVEYLLKPKFMGERSGVHPAIVAIAIIGGIYKLGLIGFVLGPVIASVTLAALEIFRQRMLKEESHSLLKLSKGTRSLKRAK